MSENRDSAIDLSGQQRPGTDIAAQQHPTGSTSANRQYNIRISGQIVAFSGPQLTIQAGVAIFHPATSRVVLVRDTRTERYFLPRATMDMGEEAARAAERAGLEWTGYRNRLLPLPIVHRHAEHPVNGREPCVTEPICSVVLPSGKGMVDVLHWYIAETLPRDLERSMGDTSLPYVAPEPFSLRYRLLDRLEEGYKDADAYEPKRHGRPATPEANAVYECRLWDVKTARGLLNGTVMEEVVEMGWKAILRRILLERTNVTNIHAI